ncbi:putative toxin-antitoxin system toxin component, PIN family [Lysobacter sp. MMG2]|nr:putative toxin-antitoxin system toxin component, PIN family [Lysobacter sp. MMG2]
MARARTSEPGASARPTSAKWPSDVNTAHGDAPPRIVLDTNVCLDLFVFGDPAVSVLRDALSAGDVVAVSSAACREEWERVLSYPALRLDEAARASRLAAYDSAMASVFGVVQVTRPLPRCRDADDQKFLELAAAASARWLLSRDDELLRLAKRTRREGLFEILAPGEWVGAWAGR